MNLGFRNHDSLGGREINRTGHDVRITGCGIPITTHRGEQGKPQAFWIINGTKY